MKFCEDCGSMLVVKTDSDSGEKFYFCRKCNKKFVLDEQVVLRTGSDDNAASRAKKEVSVFDNVEEQRNFPVTKTMCLKCKDMQECEWTMIQTRAADEPPTRFYRCRKCGHVWREYS